MLVAPALRVYLVVVNKRRDREEGEAEQADAQLSIDKRAGLLKAEDYEDVTDLKTVGFRYRT